MMTTANSLLEVRDLHVRFHGSGGDAHAVRGVSFSVGEAESVGIVGESGCGKSATLLSIPRLLPPSLATIDGTSIRFAGTDLLRAGPAELRRVRGRGIGTIFQDPLSSMNPVLRLERQLTEGPRAEEGWSRAVAREHALRLMRDVGIADPRRRLRQYPSELSGGMRQRAMFAMALASSPRLLLADEPTTALDVTVQAQILDLVRRLRDEQGMALLWVTHDMGLIAGLAQRIIVMYAGLVVEEGTARQIFREARHPYTRALISSVPRVDCRTEGELPTIGGSPPSLIDPPHGCAFAARCAYRVDRCTDERPELESVGEGGHRAACFVDTRAGEVPS